MMLPFAKYHGAGNDFLVMKASLLPAGTDLNRLIPRACDRHTGVGADGFILVGEDPLEMIYYNQDGTRAPMCGNGIRCTAAFVLDEGMQNGDVFSIETLAGTKTIHVLNRHPYRFQVEMGKGVFDNEHIDVSVPERIWNYPVTIGPKDYALYSFFMATTHTVVFSESPREDREQAGEALCHYPVFEKQTNVNFVKVLDDSHIQVLTYERGCGPTLACGTGVCASVLTCVLEGKTGRNVEVQLEKGVLQIEVLEDGSVLMSGPAERICKGELYYDQTA